MSQGSSHNPPRTTKPSLAAVAKPAQPIEPDGEDSIEIEGADEADLQSAGVEEGEAPASDEEGDLDDLDAIDRFGPARDDFAPQGTVVADISRLAHQDAELKLAKVKGATIASTQIEPLPANVSGLIEFEDTKDARFQLTKTVTVIGRAAGAADLVLPWNEEASREHFAILFSQGTFFLEDLKSSNGTFVNEQPVERVRLKSGDKIRIGSQVLVFRYRA
ncbi:MAG: FHA domain-containing protein [Deltaproteobacteria bacterium]|nr:FHA domain-containing protein [Deltaproteobacteria bacterium]